MREASRDLWLDVIVRSVADLGQYDVVWVWLLRADGQFDLLAADGVPQAAEDWLHPSAFSCPCLRQLVTGTLVTGEHFADCPRLEATGQHVAVPLRHDGRTVGLLGCGRHHQPITAPELARLGGFANLIAPALQQSAEREQTVSDLRAHRRLLHLQALALMQSGNAEEAAVATAQALLGQLAIDGVRIYGFVDQTLVCLAAAGLPARELYELRALAVAGEFSSLPITLDAACTRQAICIDCLGYLVIERLAGLDEQQSIGQLATQAAQQLALAIRAGGG